jgi:transcriptional regulator with XRE-family HTH domain
MRLRVEVGRALRAGRQGAGLSQATAGRRAGLSQNKVSRLERGSMPGSVDDLAKLASVVGLDLVVQFYPGGTPLRDHAHVRVLARLQALVGFPAPWRTEVPIPISGDQRALDAVLVLGGRVVGFELETRLVDAQAVSRRVMLKARDAGVAALILVVADTRWNRSALAAAAPTLRASFPLDRREVLAALRTGRAPSANGILAV